MQLQQFAGRQGGSHRGDDIEDTQVAHISHQFDDLSQQIISYEHGDLIAPARMHGFDSATHGGRVHHIVVNERGGMQQFERHGGLNSLIRHAMTHLSRQEGQLGTQLFTALSVDILQHTVEQRIIATQSLLKGFLVEPKLFLNGTSYVFYAGHDKWNKPALARA